MRVCLRASPNEVCSYTALKSPAAPPLPLPLPPGGASNFNLALIGHRVLCHENWEKERERDRERERERERREGEIKKGPRPDLKTSPGAGPPNRGGVLRIGRKKAGSWLSSSSKKRGRRVCCAVLCCAGLFKSFFAADFCVCLFVCVCVCECKRVCLCVCRGNAAFFCLYI